MRAIGPDERLFLIDRLIQTAFHDDDTLDAVAPELLAGIAYLAHGSPWEVSSTLYDLLRAHFQDDDVIWNFVTPRDLSFAFDRLSHAAQYVLGVVAETGRCGFVPSTRATIDAGRELVQKGFARYASPIPPSRLCATLLGRHFVLEHLIHPATLALAAVSETS